MCWVMIHSYPEYLSVKYFPWFYSSTFHSNIMNSVFILQFMFEISKINIVDSDLPHLTKDVLWTSAACLKQLCNQFAGLHEQSFGTFLSTINGRRKGVIPYKMILRFLCKFSKWSSPFMPLTRISYVLLIISRHATCPIVFSLLCLNTILWSSLLYNFFSILLFTNLKLCWCFMLLCIYRVYAKSFCPFGW